jgi:diguanylate cyclase (GGDEF)-like protein/PAS domain S-box-containing protein
MLGIGRRCNSAGGDGVAAGEASRGPAGAGLRAAVVRAWRWPNRVGRKRLMPRLTASGPLPVRNLVTLLGGIVAIVTALSAPIGYGIIGYLKEAQSLKYRAELTASRAAQYIYAPEAPWRYDTDQLAAISEIVTPTAVPIVQRLIDKQGAAMMQKGKPLPWPTFAREAPIYASGALVGTAEVSASLRPLLAEVSVVAVGALVLAIAAYLAFAILPLGVIDRTLGEVKAANDKLEQQNLLLDTALENMGQGLAMYDAEARIVIANDRYARLYGLDPEQIKPGTSLRRIVELRMANGLYAGQNVDDVYTAMRERRMATNVATQVTNKLPCGCVIVATIQPRADGGWVVTHQDVSERETLNAQLARQNELLKQREEELNAQNERFNAAINNMSQGMSLFDSEQRVVFANRRFAEIYGLAPEVVRPGTTLRQILTARAAKGVYNNVDAVKFVEEGVASFGEAMSQILQLADGRFISVVRRPMADGGLVSTHEDVSEREKLYARLAAQNDISRRQEEELKAQNERFDTALRNMSHGLCMFDGGQRVLIANHRYAEIYGLTSDQVKPGTTLRQIVEHRIARGLYAGANPEAYIKDRLAKFAEASVVVHRLSDGRAICVRRQPMRGGGWVSTHEDITEREKLTAELEQNHKLLSQRTSRLQAIIDNFPGGITFLDGDLRVVLANDRARKLLDLPDRLFANGPPTLESLFRFNAERGEYGKGDVGEQVAKRMALAEARTAHAFERERPDGTVVEVRGVPLDDGGFVTTYMDATERRRSQARIVHMALHDSLTDLPNRVLLNERLEHALTRVKRGEIVAVHLLDLDHFKTVNDTLGHPAGDQLLKMVTGRLQKLVRETDTVARMGGDEFAVLQVAISQPADATALALRVIEAVSAPYTIDGQQVVIGTSVGIAVGPADGLAPDQLIRNSDLALYRAKADGRGTYRFFGPEMDAQMQARHLMEHDLRNALPAGEFELHYQPVVNLESNEISGVEALIRWRHPEKGIVPPSAFIPVAEEIGFIVPLGEWVIRQACATAAKWPGDVRIAVNLSPIQFRNPGFVQVVVSALAASGLAADRLELEITESVLLQDSEATLSTLYQLRGLGVRIAMDDFGTGYSSLSYLQSFPFDKIKIDRSFVKDIVDGVGSLNIVRAVAAMANGLGMATTAEGVETKEQLDTVKAEGCTEMQGFLFSRPVPAEEIEALLLARCKAQGSAESSAGFAA